MDARTEALYKRQARLEIELAIMRAVAYQVSYDAKEYDRALNTIRDLENELHQVQAQLKEAQ